MLINKQDVIWNYAATFLKIGSSIILLPLILRMMPAEMVGIWSIFMTITAFASLLDFGFNSSFTRNVTYVFSGVQKLNVNGYQQISNVPEVDYGLLKGVIGAMRWFYLRIALVLFIFLSTLGTYYLYYVLGKYSGDTTEVYLAWAILCLINTYNLFSLYYDSLLQGRGLIKKSKQITIIGYLVYLLVSVILIMNGYGLVAIISAQACSVIVIRFLSYRAFFTPEINLQILKSKSHEVKEVLRAIYPNAIKVGLTSLGGFVIQKSSIIIGSLYLSLPEIATYGITMQFIGVIAALAGIYIGTYIPKISFLRIKQDIGGIRKIYARGVLIMVCTFLICGSGLCLLGNWALDFIGSKTHLMPSYLILLAILLSFVETNLSTAGSVLLTKNEVPFFKASLWSGVLTIIGLLAAFKLANWGLLTMVAVQLVVSLSYQAWKWPLEVIKDLKIKLRFVNFN